MYDILHQNKLFNNFFILGRPRCPAKKLFYSIGQKPTHQESPIWSGQECRLSVTQDSNKILFPDSILEKSFDLVLFADSFVGTRGVLVNFDLNFR